MYKLNFQSPAEDFIKKLYFADKSHFMRIKSALFSLQQDPFIGKALTRKLKGMYSLRVGMYRIVYSIEQNIITINVLKIGHRKDVYN